MPLSPEQARRLAQAPVARLATASADGVPHVIPVCFAMDPQTGEQPIYSVLDRKPKRAALTRLRRVRNILENPQVALVVDHYEADWGKLWYILVTGRAQLLTEDTSTNADQERVRAIELLRAKYPQYRTMDIDANPVLRISPERAVAWAFTPEPGS